MIENEIHEKVVQQDIKILESIITEALDRLNMSIKFQKQGLFSTGIVFELSLRRGMLVNENNIKVDSLSVIMTMDKDTSFPIAVVAVTSEHGLEAYKSLLQQLLIIGAKHSVDKAINYISNNQATKVQNKEFLT